MMTVWTMSTAQHTKGHQHQACLCLFLFDRCGNVGEGGVSAPRNHGDTEQTVLLMQMAIYLAWD